MKDSNMLPEHIETTTKAALATIASYTSSGSLLIFGMATNDLLALFGVAGIVFTNLVNWYYRHKESKKK